MRTRTLERKKAGRAAGRLVRRLPQENVENDGLLYTGGGRAFDSGSGGMLPWDRAAHPWTAGCHLSSGGRPDSVCLKALDAREQSILVMLRLPRVAAALAAGAGLGTAGAAMQAITANPMASPFTTGLSSAAALGAAVVLVFGGVSPFMAKTATVAAAFFMALLCAALVFGIANYKGMGREALVLTGIALNYFFSALNSTMQFIANEEQLRPLSTGPLAA